VFADPQSGEPIECLSPFGLANLAVGSHTFEVRAIDDAGNADPTPASHTWTVLDSTEPDTAFTSSPAASTTETSAMFTFSSNELGSTFECSLDSAVFAVCTSPATLTGLTVDSHTFEVRAVDPSGNVDPTPVSHTWTIESPDTVAPETLLTSQPSDPSTGTVSFGFTASDDLTPELLLTYQCRLDSTNPLDWTACISPANFADLSVGAHTFEVRAVDEAGNADPTPASYTWSVISADTTPPETTIDSGPADGLDTSATFTFSASEPGATFTCALDGVSAPCSSPVTYTGLSIGDHTFLARAADAAGNVDPTAAVHEWTVEAPPTPTPTATSVLPTSTPTATPTATPLPVSCTTITLSASADAWIDSGSTSQNKGDDSILKVQAKSGNNNRALLHFNLPTVPQGCTIQSATLRLYASSWKNGRTIQALRINGSWTENGVNWSNQPATTGTAATTSSGSGYRQWNVLAHVQAMYGGTNNGFLIRDASEGGGGNEQQYNSREKGQNMPQLVIAFVAGATPTPTTVPPTPTPTGETGSPTPTPTSTPTETSLPPTPTPTSTTVAACTPSTVTVSAGADAWIDQNSASSNYGSDSILKVQAKDGNNFRALVQFALPNEPAGCVVQSATLRLYAPSSAGGRTLEALQLSGSWSESGVNWSNQPATTGAAATTGSGNGYREWSVTGMVQSMYASSNNGFLIRDASEGGGGSEQQFHSREKGESMPELVITFAPAP
jgi:hypothetical protein